MQTRSYLTGLLAAALLTLNGCAEIAGGIVAGGLLLWALLGLLQLIIVIVAVVDLVKRPLSTEKKIFWGVIIFIIPVAGALLYWFIGREPGKVSQR